ncbi:THAP domain-containing protein 1 [Plakobranchus ocellatus]|uniref:THAP domain-containing protein 1 n=1 Tax=Plakobranchus ocellatus TaxID=259542 RepID=A0AAV4CP23_9GAST|nr:THAP domain-containing protein 1 [Plakobranchus ocellatus]
MDLQIILYVMSPQQFSTQARKQILARQSLIKGKRRSELNKDKKLNIIKGKRRSELNKDKKLNICKQWVIATRRADLEKKSPTKLHRSSAICEEHFEPSCFRQTKRKLLTQNAVPTIFNIPNPPPSQSSSRPPPKERIYPKNISLSYRDEITHFKYHN